MRRLTEEELIKRNTIRLAEHHKQHCEDPECNISMFLLGRLLGKAGFELTDAERLIFL